MIFSPIIAMYQPLAPWLKHRSDFLNKWQCSSCSEKSKRSLIQKPISDFHLTGSKYSTLLIWYVLLLGKLDSYRVNLIMFWLLGAYRLSFWFFCLSLKLPACAVIFTNHINLEDCILFFYIISSPISALYSSPYFCKSHLLFFYVSASCTYLHQVQIIVTDYLMT